jgi:hypothetical protein
MQTQKFAHMEWPSHWAVLKRNLDRKRTKPGGAEPFVDPSGALLEVPVFGGGAGISEWLVVELDLDYVRNVWLPELVRTFLNFGDKALYDVEVKTVTTPATMLYSSSPMHRERRDTYSVRFHHQGRPKHAPAGCSG